MNDTSDAFRLVQNRPYVSVVIPVYNEEGNLQELYTRLKQALDMMNKPYEIIFTNDGSKDKSIQILKRLAADDPSMVVIDLSRNFGQHAAVYAAFTRSQGEIVVTLDADLQNPPEEIPKLVHKIEEGFETVGGVRGERNDSMVRKGLSYMLNRVASRVVGVTVKDYGCMLRAYRRSLVDDMLQYEDLSVFIPALAASIANNAAEVIVDHSARTKGKSKYNFMKLLSLNFDLLTGFSLLPIQMLTVLGVLTSLCGILFGFFLLVRRLFVGPEVEGAFTLFAVLFVFVGLLFLALGMIGEYIGRIYLEVRHRPRFIIRRIYSKEQRA
ncbi:MAG TPA: glycosyltransferase [bacterium]|nr:glycosyltransferase [bacterium]